MPGTVKQVVTSFNEKELAKITAYAKKKGLSLYGLLKRAVREYVERHP